MEYEILFPDVNPAVDHKAEHQNKKICPGYAHDP